MLSSLHLSVLIWALARGLCVSRGGVPGRGRVAPLRFAAPKSALAPHPSVALHCSKSCSSGELSHAGIDSTLVPMWLGGSEAGVAGLYIGSGAAKTITVPASHLGSNGTLLVFLAHNISTAAIDFGTAADTRVTVNWHTMACMHMAAAAAQASRS